MESFRDVITFQSVLITRVNLRIGYVYAFILLKSPCMHAHLRNVLKYDYLIMKTKEAIGRKRNSEFVSPVLRCSCECVSLVVSVYSVRLSLVFDVIASVPRWSLAS